MPGTSYLMSQQTDSPTVKKQDDTGLKLNKIVGGTMMGSSALAIPGSVLATVKDLQDVGKAGEKAKWGLNLKRGPWKPNTGSALKNTGTALGAVGTFLLGESIRRSAKQKLRERNQERTKQASKELPIVKFASELPTVFFKQAEEETYPISGLAKTLAGGYIGLRGLRAYARARGLNSITDLPSAERAILETVSGELKASGGIITPKVRSLLGKLGLAAAALSLPIVVSGLHDMWGREVRSTT